MRKLSMNLAALLFVQGVSLAYAADVNVGVVISGQVQPGVYGRVEVGNGPPPPLLYPQPVIIVRQPPAVVVTPLYLHVPPGHAKHWAKHCRKYNACDRPVYFVKSEEYEPGYKHGKGNKRKHRGDD